MYPFNFKKSFKNKKKFKIFCVTCASDKNTSMIKKQFKSFKLVWRRAP